jgi:glycosyltransferase involved in cell wall biosynthesis
MHTQAKDYTGWDIPQIVIDHHLENKIVLSDKTAKMIGDVHVSPRMMRDYYVMSDVHAITSGGEGFGIPMVEAMACGIPNVAPAYTTPKEFLCDKIMKDGVETLENGVRGFAIPYVDIEHHFTGGIWALVDCEKMAASFQTLYENPTLRHQMGTKARKFAVENYDDKPIKNKWVELFEHAPEIAKKMAEEDETPHKEYIRAVRFNAGQHK